MPTEILIVDNDPIVSNLTSELLQDAGFTTEALHEGSQTLAIIRTEHPRAVLLDIMMPGLDGLNICRMIKSSPDIKNVKVIIVSAKSFDAEKQRALKYGADLFIGKPYDIDAFAEQIMSVVGRPTQPAAPKTSRPSPQTPSPIKAQIWGARTTGTPQSHTPCVSVETSSHLFIFDAGTGILPLGQQVMQAGKFREAWIFLTHFHPDHIENLGLFPCSRVPGFKLHIAGPNDPDKTLEQAVREAIESSFATNPKPIESNLQLYELQEGAYDILPGVKLTTVFSNHPTTTLAFSLKTAGRHIAYCPDNELHGEAASAFEDSDEVLGNAFRDADILIHDARYAPEDYEKHRNQGHSHFMNAVEFAAKYDVKNLILFHQDAAYTAAQIQTMEQQAQAWIKQHESSLTCRAAQEGLTIST